jgi:hypothetical protein
MKKVAKKEVVKKEPEQYANLKGFHNNMQNALSLAKKDFPKLDVEDLNVFEENLDVFCRKLRGVWYWLGQYKQELQHITNINHLQFFIDKGLQFENIEIDNQTYVLREADGIRTAAPFDPTIDDNKIPF